MTQLAAKFFLTPAECEAIEYALKQEVRASQDSYNANQSDWLYQAMSTKRINTDNNQLSFHWPILEARGLLNRLLAGCPELATACGLYDEENSLQHAEWAKHNGKEIETACQKVLEGLGFAYPI